MWVDDVGFVVSLPLVICKFAGTGEGSLAKITGITKVFLYFGIGVGLSGGLRHNLFADDGHLDELPKALEGFLFSIFIGALLRRRFLGAGQDGRRRARGGAFAGVHLLIGL